VTAIAGALGRLGGSATGGQHKGRHASGRPAFVICEKTSRSFGRDYFAGGLAVAAAASVLGASSFATFAGLTVPLACVKLNWLPFILAL
jgi:hypothetical protein